MTTNPELQKTLKDTFHMDKEKYIINPENKERNMFHS